MSRSVDRCTDNTAWNSTLGMLGEVRDVTDVQGPMAKGQVPGSSPYAVEYARCMRDCRVFLRHDGRGMDQEAHKQGGRTAPGFCCRLLFVICAFTPLSSTRCATAAQRSYIRAIAAVPPII